MPDKTTKLEALKIEETSGVDAPANLLPGWMVTKALRTDYADIEKGVAGLDDETVRLFAERIHEVTRANPQQPRAATSGRFRQAIPGLDPDRPASESGAAEAAPDVPAQTEKGQGLQFFRPGGGYSRIW